MSLEDYPNDPHRLTPKPSPPLHASLIRTMCNWERDGKIDVKAASVFLAHLESFITRYDGVSWDNMTPEEQEHLEMLCEQYEIIEIARQTRVKRNKYQG